MAMNLRGTVDEHFVSALQEQPSLVFSFYSFGVMLRKTDGEVTREYPVDPAQVALALAAKVSFDTGLLGGNTLLVRQDGVKKTMVEYRPPGKTGIFLDDSEAALRRFQLSDSTVFQIALKITRAARPRIAGIWTRNARHSKL
jgi:hypothetical protein